jgi:lipopolysaccharide/colanic/teichoic acid biosynthesis glycosyltransferase
MSLVGPRPERPGFVDEFTRQIPFYAERHCVKPGITGWAQVNGFRGETAKADQIEGRVAHDIYYIDNWSPLFDFWILVLTIFSPSARRNAR